MPLRAVLLALGLLLPAASGAGAQDWWWAVSYSGAVATGDTGDFIDGYAWRGVGFEGRKMMNTANSWSLGYSLTWNIFDKKTFEATVVDEAARGVVTGTQLRYINAFPLLFTGHYYLGSRSDLDGVRGFLGGGAGLFYVERRVDIGTFAIQEENWHLGLAPELGVAFRVGRPAITASVRFNATTEAGGVSYTYWSLNLGLANY